MPIVPFLATTAAEMKKLSCYPQRIAWMACHFSPFGLGLSNIPKELPPGSMLIVDDITPPHGHNAALIVQQLTGCAEALRCCAILLDFQRKNCPETAALAQHLTKALPCPTAVSDCYAGDLDCPVFLPPVPPSALPEEHFAPWQGREIWLEIGLYGEMLTLTEQGCTVTPVPFPHTETDGFSDPKLLCHYSIETNERSARFTLWRNTDDLTKLLEAATTMGVTGAIGLFQELHRFTNP